MNENEKIKFSFEYYDDSPDAKYCISCWSPKQIKESLKRLKQINAKSFKDLLNKDSRVLHFKEVVWSETREPNGFPDTRIRDMSAFHFALLGVNEQLARVYGAYSTGTFYIVWFDLDHSIWSTKLKNT